MKMSDSVLAAQAKSRAALLCGERSAVAPRDCCTPLRCGAAIDATPCDDAGWRPWFGISPGAAA
jgi:hypothetical protein